MLRSSIRPLSGGTVMQSRRIQAAKHLDSSFGKMQHQASFQSETTAATLELQSRSSVHNFSLRLYYVTSSDCIRASSLT